MLSEVVFYCVDSKTQLHWAEGNCLFFWIGLVMHALTQYYSSSLRQYVWESNPGTLQFQNVNVVFLSIIKCCIVLYSVILLFQGNVFFLSVCFQLICLFTPPDLPAFIEGKDKSSNKTIKRGIGNKYNWNMYKFKSFFFIII